MSRVVCETCCKAGMVMIFGEITTATDVNYEGQASLTPSQILDTIKGEFTTHHVI